MRKPKDHNRLPCLEGLESRALLAQSPYPSSTPTSMPGTVEAENYDRGGEGVAYHDTTAGNATGAYRSDNVDVEPGGSNGFCVGHIRAGEYLEWTINLTQSGTYRFETAVATKNSGGNFRISIDSINKTGSLVIPNTGGWHNWTTVTRSGISLAGGTHVMRLTIESSVSGGDVGNIDFVRLVQTGSTPIFAPRPLNWQIKATNPLRREEAQSLVYNGKLYQLGGYIPGFAASYRVDVYNPATNTWSRKHDMPYNITHAAVAPDPDGKSFWFVGGFLGSFTTGADGHSHGPPGTNIVYKYNAATDTWTKMKSLPVAHGAGGAGIVNNKLYFFGGADATRSFDRKEAYVLNLANQSAGWTRIADLPSPRNHLGGIVAGGKIYAIGGQFKLEDQGSPTSIVQRYDPATNQWTQMASLPKALSHYNAATVLFDRYIITVGGESTHNLAQPYIFAYDTVANKWARMTDLPGPRRAGIAGLVGTKLIQATGWNISQGQTATTYIADLANVFA